MHLVLPLLLASLALCSPFQAIELVELTKTPFNITITTQEPSSPPVLHQTQAADDTITLTRIVAAPTTLYSPFTVTVTIKPAQDTSSANTPSSSTMQNAMPTLLSDVPTTNIPSSTTTYSALTSVLPSGSAVTWAQPVTMTDLSAWRTSSIPGYVKRNLVVVSSVPASAYASSSMPPTVTPHPPPLLAGIKPSSDLAFDHSAPKVPKVSKQTSPISDEASAKGTNGPSRSLIRLLYPAGSTSPSSPIPGGANFYASLLKPAILARTKTATLAYRVFFPAGFDFVKGGKLPGLYGGHGGCSGGNDAETCWSTRLMWRAKGLGELYLYAPKTQQTAELCRTPPRSICSGIYGFSIGRGSFTFKTGRWMDLKQTVTLNTPGVSDGLFALEVDGREVIRREDVMYRIFPPELPKEDQSASSSPSQDNINGDLSDNVLDDLLGGLLRRDETAPMAFPLVLSPDGQIRVSGSRRPVNEEVSQPLMLQENSDAETGFAGLFFSTFFGGHSQDYASPKDQYVWMGGFEMTASW